MVARRVRILVGSAFAVGLLASAWVAPAAAADCSLSAPATVAIGTPLTIEGAGFPVSSGVDIKLTIQGGAPDEFTVQSNDSGAFQINLTPEVADLGETTVVATAGAVCSAQVVYAILSAGQTALPTTEPSAEPSGSAAVSGAQPAVPRTDAATALDGGAAGTTRNAWVLAILALTIGGVGLVATRTTRGR
jgi:hypothetical protein